MSANESPSGGGLNLSKVFDAVRRPLKSKKPADLEEKSNKNQHEDQKDH